MFKKLSPDLKSSFWFAFCAILQKCISIVSTPIFSRILSVEEYGILTVYNTWFTILFYFATLNFAGALYNTLINKDIGQKHNYAINLLIISSIISIIIAIFVAIFPEWFANLTGLSSILIFIILGNCVFSTAFSFWQIQQRFEKKYVLMVVITILFTALSIGFPILSVLVFEKTAFSKLIVSEGISILFGLSFTIYFFARSNKKLDWGIIKHALVYSLPLLPHFLSSIILNQIDRVMIYNIYGYEQSAFYGAAHSISNILSVIIVVVNNAAIPFIYEKIKNNDFAPIRKLANIIVALACLVLLLFLVLVPEVVFLLADSKYNSIVYLVPPLAAGQLFVLAYYLFANVEYYYGKTIFVTIASLIGCSCNLILNYIFIPINYVYAAYTTLISFFVYCVAHLFFMKIVCKEKVYNSYLILIMVVVTVALGLLSMLLYPTYSWIRYSIVAIAICLLLVFHKKVINIFKKILVKDS